ncbi:MAG: glycosyltransferase family 2 protein [Paracoccaceae bacterium]|nr:glycosyltransferase family 2 protein [Paracoccaceae bacterium]
MARLQTRTLGAEMHGEVCLLDALDLGDRVRLFFASSDVPAADLAVEGRAVLERQVMLGAATLDVEAGPGPVEVVWSEGRLRAGIREPEPEMFAARNVGLACRGAEAPEAAADWLRWHRDHHGMDAALIVDRAEAEGFAEALAELIAGEAGPDVTVLRPGLGLGRAGLGPESDLFFAPDAPGRDRMEPPPEDRWRGPLGEITLYELLRHRFLSRARAVMNIDLSDLLAPPQGVAVFDRAVAAAGGVVPLAGRHSYPWRVPAGGVARFADHVCRLFDSNAIRWRWCVAPGTIGRKTTWRLLRVTGAVADRSDVVPFWRCMGLRHPGHRAAALAPKSGLVEEADQLAALGDRFGAPFERMPVLSLKAPGAEGSITLVTTVKNEGPFILDWLAWHRAMGADRFLIYSNDCTDGTEELLRALDASGIVDHRNNDNYRATGRTPQHSVLAAADRDPVVRTADWTVFADVDEYINVKVGAGRFDDLFAAIPGANMISMTWRLFGNGDIHRFDARPVFEQFTRCAPELCRKPHQAWGFKTLFRNLGIYRKLGVHRPKGLHPQLAGHIRWVNGSGRPMPMSIYRNGWRSTQSTYGYDIVQLNHYAVRSAESFLVKRERGRANHVARDQGLNYWFRMNNNAETGAVNPAMLPAFEAEKARLLALPGVAAAHGEGIRRHRARIAELRADPDYAAFFETLTSPRMERLSRLLGRFGAGVFQAGPDAVPDARVFGDWAEGETFTVPYAPAAE